MTQPIAWCLTVGVVNLALLIGLLVVGRVILGGPGSATNREVTFMAAGIVTTVAGAACGFVGALIAWIWSAVP